MSQTFLNGIQAKARWNRNTVNNPYAPVDRINELEEELRQKNERIRQLEDEVFEITVLADKKEKKNGRQSEKSPKDRQ